MVAGPEEEKINFLTFQVFPVPRFQDHGFTKLDGYQEENILGSPPGGGTIPSLRESLSGGFILKDLAPCHGELNLFSYSKTKQGGVEIINDFDQRLCYFKEETTTKSFCPYAGEENFRI